MSMEALGKTEDTAQRNRVPRRDWIGRFDSKPGVICPGFWRIRYLAACPHACAFCYLQGTYWRRRPQDISGEELPALERSVRRWMAQPTCQTCGQIAAREVHIPPGSGMAPLWLDRHRHVVPANRDARLLNAGELSDSFAPKVCEDASLLLIDLFRQQDQHTLLLLSKAMPACLLEVAPTPQVIISFSLSQTVLKGQFPGEARIAPDIAPGNLRALVERGWRVRLRLDPLVDSLGALTTTAIVREAGVQFERITLGTLRFTQRTFWLMREGRPLQRALADRVVWQGEGDIPGSHPYRLLLESRVKLYRQALSLLDGCAPVFALCKETAGCWQGVCGEIPQGQITCNCTL